jgi:hypothetical protein
VSATADVRRLTDVGTEPRYIFGPPLEGFL